MPGTVNERLADAAVSHAVDFAQYSNGVVRRIIALLNRVDPDLMAQLSAAMENLTAANFTTGRLEQLLYSVRALNAAAYQSIERELTKELIDLAAYEVGYQLELFAATIPPQVVVQVGLGTVDAAQVYAAAMARPFQGVLLREALAGLEDGRARLIRDSIRIGYVENQTTSEIVRRLRGARVNGYADGLLEAPRRNVETIVRTAVSHTASVAREKFYQANQSLIKAMSWNATLDTRTSTICKLRDGKHYTPETHKPIGHKLPWLGGPGKAHWNCRSVEVPITKSWRDLGLDMDEMDAGTRASMDGQVPAETNYGDWLKNQSARRQDEILGPARGQLMREGGLTLEKFANEKGLWLTLDDLKKRDAAAFKRAGL